MLYLPDILWEALGERIIKHIPSLPGRKSQILVIHQLLYHMYYTPDTMTGTSHTRTHFVPFLQQPCETGTIIILGTQKGKLRYKSSQGSCLNSFCMPHLSTTITTFSGGDAPSDPTSVGVVMCPPGPCFLYVCRPFISFPTSLSPPFSQLHLRTKAMCWDLSSQSYPTTTNSALTVTLPRCLASPGQPLTPPARVLSL